MYTKKSMRWRSKTGLPTIIGDVGLKVKITRQGRVEAKIKGN